MRVHPRPTEALLETELHHRPEGGRRLPFLVWRLPPRSLVLSSGPVGGGVGPRAWVLNAQVPLGYARTDLEDHVAELAAAAGLAAGAGTGLLTAAEVAEHVPASDAGVAVVATVGLGQPEWAAAPARGGPDLGGPHRPGTINVVAWVPVPLTGAALVNAATTATEAKVQALVEAGVDGSGTATDAVVVACPAPAPGGVAEAFAGPRSRWGAPLARAVHASVAGGIPASLARAAAWAAPAGAGPSGAGADR